MRTIDWIDGRVRIIDQTALPGELTVLELARVEELIDAITSLAVRGAPALGVAGAMGVALIARDPRYPTPDTVRTAAVALQNARPTAVNLSWGVKQALLVADQGADAILAAALEVRDREILNSTQMGERGADLVAELKQGRLNVMTICNTGALATVERGTALSLVRSLFERDLLGEVIALETRPLLQGARLTAWELSELGIPHRLTIDSAGPALISRGAVDLVVIGADRIADNGDTANKVGSYSLALAAQRAGIPFIVVAPESTVDAATASGDDIEIEDRGSAEVVSLRGVAIAPAGTRAVNPAFDVTPHDLITAIVTESRVIRPNLP
jgi:methylthioribose-1-phosphate isomerase